MQLFRTLLFLVLLVAAPLNARAQTSPQTKTSCPTATLDAARKLAEKAAAFFKANGPEPSYARFRDPKGGFLRGDLYVFVAGMDGTLLFNARYPEYVGSLLGGRSGLGGRMLAIVRAKGRGWVEYRWYNPCSARIEPKISYFIRVGHYVVGVGAYRKIGV